MARTGVLITGFGAPEGQEGIAPFMCNLMGREPSDELLQRVCRRYLAIGGSPLNEIAAAIAGKLSSELNDLGKVVPIAVGMRYAPPFIPDALKQLKERECDRIVVVSLSPFESKVAHGAYRQAIDAAVSEIGELEIVEAPLVGDMPEYAEFYAMSAATALTELDPNEGALLVFTAHSLPLSDISKHDPYVEGLERVARSVADQLGLGDGAHGVKPPVLPDIDTLGSMEPPRGWFLAYQSKGARGGDWLGPDVEDVIEAIGRSAAPAVVIVPIGFMTDHLETLYDLDIIAAEKALDADLEFKRAITPNDEEMVIKAIAQAVSELI